MTESQPKIRIRDLHKAFGRKVVLNGANLDVGVGESVVVIGGSGTGKSVLLKCILGLLNAGFRLHPGRRRGSGRHGHA